MSAGRRRAAFEQLFLPLLPASYNLARWLTRHPQDAEDMVQEAYLRAFKAFETYAGDDSTAWLLRIVRNTCLTWLKQKKNVVVLKEAYRENELLHPPEKTIEPQQPDDALAQRLDRARVHAAIAQLPEEFREVIVLRELEGLSYRQISGIVGAPSGTVMSRLARGRRRLRDLLRDDDEGQQNEL